jgi:ATP adenylyltransferase
MTDDRNINLWAPWRMEYINGLGEEQGCFLCRCRDEGGRERENFLLWRSPHALVVMNRFPYNGGHLLIAPPAHVPSLAELDEAAMAGLLMAARDAQDVLAAVLKPQGFNMGINFGKCAGAGLPGHLHLHLVPRWEGDTNFMTVVGDIRVIPQALETLYEQLRQQAEAAGHGM